MRALLLVGLGGFLGAAGRHGLNLLLGPRGPASFPYATFSANVVGCFLIGVLLGVARETPWLDEGARLFLVVGLLGSFTTFSTFGHETLELLAEGQLGRALLNAAGSLAVGLLAVWLGHLAVR